MVKGYQDTALCLDDGLISVSFHALNGRVLCKFEKLESDKFLNANQISRGWVYFALSPALF